MGIELKVINGLIKFFERIKANSERVIHELKFMKYTEMFDERDDDIYVATFIKSGTTWMQMILYQLTTDGNMNFNHIYDVSPWLRNLAETGGEIKPWPSPRIIKTHEAYHQVSRYRKGRYIYVIRDGRDVAVSLYHHARNYNNNNINFEETFKETFVESGETNWFEFNRAWLENKHCLPVLYVLYEDLKNDLPTQLDRIANFLHVQVKTEDIPRILERTTFAFMKQHETKFGEQPPVQKMERVYNQFIRTGNSGEGKEMMSAEQLGFFNQQFQQQLSGFEVVKAYADANTVKR